MSQHRHGYNGGLGEDAGESVLMVTSTPSGQPTRQADTSATDWGQVINTTLPVLANVYQQQQLTRLNVARINAGQPPITASDWARTYQPPSAQVQVGVTSRAEKMIMFGGLAVLALVGLRAAKII